MKRNLFAVHREMETPAVSVMDEWEGQQSIKVGGLEQSQEGTFGEEGETATTGSHTFLSSTIASDVQSQSTQPATDYVSGND